MENEIYNNTTKITVDDVGGYIKLENDEQETVYKLDSVPLKDDGYYCIGKPGGGSSIHLIIGKKPSWLARTMCRLLLEWYWVDHEIK